MSKKLLTLMFCALLGGGMTVLFSGVAAQAGPPPTCGNGEPDEGEECDDGNQTNGDGCDDDVANGGNCTTSACGNGVVAGAEECDDGNTANDDGCSDACVFECGNGVENTGEDCDDGNRTNGDGCDDDPLAESPGNCTETVCGNGVITAPEECDPPAPGECSEECLEIGEPQTKKQQGCINAVNKNLAGVAKSQGADYAKCVKDVAAGKAGATPESCPTSTGKKTTKAQGKTSSTVTGKKCTQEPPTILLTDAATVNDAGSDQVLEGLEVLLGNPPVIVAKATDKAGAKCQAEAVKQYNAIVSKWLAEANKAKKSSLKGGKKQTPPPAAIGSEVAAAIDAALQANTKVEKAKTKAGTNLAKKCTDAQVDGLFDCGGATTVAALTTCIQDEASRAACEALEAADGMDLTCP